MLTITPQAVEPSRQHPRVDAGFMVKVAVDGRSVVAKARDLSMAGLKVLGDFHGVGRRVTVAIPIPGEREVVTFATIRRTEDGEAALEFDQLDWDDIIALSRYVHPRLP